MALERTACESVVRQRSQNMGRDSGRETGAIAQMIPVRTFDSTAARVLAIAVVAAVAVPLALPTFFEIPLALILLSSGAPVGAAVALLIAGPSVNLPSLLTIMRSTNWKVSAVAAASIWTLAVASGILVSFL